VTYWRVADEVAVGDAAAAVAVEHAWEEEELLVVVAALDLRPAGRHPCRGRR
jgi:hypothetical protein